MFVKKVKNTLYFMMKDLGLQLLDVVGRDRSVLYDPVRFLYQALEVSHFLFVLLVLHNCLLKHKYENARQCFRIFK